MAYNIADFKNLVRSVMIYNIKNAFPDLDTSDNSVFDDIFIKPIVEFVRPLIDTVNNAEFMLNLNNAEFMQEADLDSIGLGNYNIERKTGVKGTTVMSLSFSKVIPEEDLIIPVGITFLTGNNLQFQTTSSTTFTYAELVGKYNTVSLTYDVDVNVEAFEPGVQYNVAENQITSIESPFNPYLQSMTNKVAVTNATDKETNASYAERIRDFYISRHLNTKPGYEQYIYANFPEIEDVYVVGFGDADMERDIITVINDSSVPEDMHIGGKVDIYLKGCNYEDKLLNLSLHTPNLPLTRLYSEIDLSSIVVLNVSEPTKTPVYTLADDGNDACILTLDNTGDVSYDPDKENSFTVTYNYDDGGGIPLEYIDNFIVGISQIEFETPFTNILAVHDIEDDTVTYTDSDYELIRTNFHGDIISDPADTFYASSQENVKFNFINYGTTVNGTQIDIDYVINNSINGMREFFNEDENRVITTDLLIKEATPIFINISFYIKLYTGQSLDDVKVSAIQNSLNDYFNNLSLGGRVDESDIVGHIYQDSNIKNFLEYVSLPFESFYIADDPAEAMIVQRDGTYIETDQKQYPVLNKFFVNPL